MSRAQKSNGQTTVEMAVLVGAVVTAFIAMSLYVQRAYQGYLYSTSSTHGPQFEPNHLKHPYLEVQRLESSFRPRLGTTPLSGPSFRQIQDITVKEQTELGPIPSGNDEHRLPSVRGGTLPGRILKTEITVTTDWNVNRGACYGDPTPCEELARR